MTRVLASLVLMSVAGEAAIVDRIAVVVNKRAIKDSDITEDVRITAFLNNEQPSVLPNARKKAADRLIDQVLIRDEINQGEYPIASLAEAKSFLASIKKPRFATEAVYQKALTSYNLTEDDLLDRLTWELTVLRFIDIRFRPAVNPSDAETQQYFNAHRQDLTAHNPGKTTLDQLKGVVQDAVVSEQVDKALDDWLKQRRQDATIIYQEGDLK